MSQPIQIISFDDSRKLKLNKSELEKILHQEELKGLPISVLSVVGAFRTGKSFLLSWLIRYLKANSNKKSSSTLDGSKLFEKDEPLLTGFKWKSGAEPDTQGIWAWSEIFIINDHAGQKVGVLLIDTQGLFDGNNTLKQNGNIFTLSTLISSIQIFNLSQKMQEDNLENLQMFAEFGRLALSKDNSNKKIKPFQRIVFLIRDWQYPKGHPYGSQGGESYLKKYLSVREGQAEEISNELSERRLHLHECFAQVQAYLMPHPGKKVANDDGNFDGRPSEMKYVFKDHLEKFIGFLFPTNGEIQPKIVAGGRILTTNDVAGYIESYVNLLNSDEGLSPISIFEATAKVNNNALARDAVKEYKNYVDSVEDGTGKSSLNDQDLKKYHEEFKKKALEYFEKHQMGDSAPISGILDQLNIDFEVDFEHWKNRNERVKVEILNLNEAALKSAEKIYSSFMEDWFKTTLNIPYFTASELNDQHLKIQQSSSDLLKSQLKGTDELTASFMSQLQQYSQEQFASHMIPKYESMKKHEEDHLEKIRLNRLREAERRKKEQAQREKEEADSKRREAEREAKREASDSSWRKQAAEAESRRHAAEVENVRRAAESENQQRLRSEKAKQQTELEKLRGSLLGAINRQFQ